MKSPKRIRLGWRRTDQCSGCSLFPWQSGTSLSQRVLWLSLRHKRPTSDDCTDGNSHPLTCNPDSNTDRLTCGQRARECRPPPCSRVLERDGVEEWPLTSLQRRLVKAALPALRICRFSSIVQQHRRPSPISKSASIQAPPADTSYRESSLTLQRASRQGGQKNDAYLQSGSPSFRDRDIEPGHLRIPVQRASVISAENNMAERVPVANRHCPYHQPIPETLNDRNCKGEHPLNFVSVLVSL